MTKHNNQVTFRYDEAQQSSDIKENYHGTPLLVGETLASLLIRDCSLILVLLKADFASEPHLSLDCHHEQQALRSTRAAFEVFKLTLTLALKLAMTGFAQHKGYGSTLHRDLIHEHGPQEGVHRKRCACVWLVTYGHVLVD
eukprot:1158662-Pelagomonas_calceolata.AAC.1